MSRTNIFDGDDLPFCPLEKALCVEPITHNTYNAFMHPDHGHGTSALGGFCFSQIQLALQHYFDNTRKELNQPDTLSIQVVFLAPVPTSDVTIRITDVSLGKSYSTVQVAIHHNGLDKVVGYASQTNLSRSRGPTFHIPQVLQPAPAPNDFTKMNNNVDPHWIRFAYPWTAKSFVKGFSHAERWIPRYSNPPNIQEYWFRLLPNTQRITTAMLGSLIDNFARPPENWRPGSPGSHAGMLAQAYWHQRTGRYLLEDPSFAGEMHTKPSTVTSSEEKRQTNDGRTDDISREHDDSVIVRQALAYPTMTMSLEIRKPLPAQGVEWMYCRATTMVVSGGKFDITVALLDQDGDVVATSHQISLMLDMSKSASERSNRGKAKSRL